MERKQRTGMGGCIVDAKSDDDSHEDKRMGAKQDGKQAGEGTAEIEKNMHAIPVLHR
jgi:hypothetical protein